LLAKWTLGLVGVLFVVPYGTINMKGGENVKNFEDFRKLYHEYNMNAESQKLNEAIIAEIASLPQGNTEEKLFAMCQVYSLDMLHRYHEWVSQDKS